MPVLLLVKAGDEVAPVVAIEGGGGHSCMVNFLNLITLAFGITISFPSLPINGVLS